MECIIKEERSVNKIMLLCGYVLALFGGIIGLLIGNHLLTGYISEQGEELYKFDETSRRHGKIITTLAVVMIILCLFINLAVKL